MSDRREEPEPESEWDAYSDFQHVSRSVSKTILEAVRAIQTIESAKVSGEKLQSREESDLRSDVLTAVTLVRAELENEREQNEVYESILSRWEGENGFITRFKEMDAILPQSEPWLQQFADDIHRAGWELGYLKAGREEKQSRGGDAYDGEVRDMIEEMTI